MDSETQDLLLQKLEELVIDEEKIITVTSASKLLNVAVQDASKLLKTFAEDQKKTSTNVSCKFILSGVLNDGNLGVKLVREDQVEKEKQSFKSVSSEVLYSVEKTKDIDNYNFVSVDDFERIEDKDYVVRGSIVGKTCVLRNLNTKPKPKPEVKPVVKGKSSFFIKSASSTEAEVKQETTKQENKEKGNFFTKAASTGSGDNKNTTEKRKGETKQVSKSKANGGIASFFNKMPSKEAITEKAQSVSPESFSAESQTSSGSIENNKIDAAEEKKTAAKGKEKCFTEKTVNVDSDKDILTEERSEKNKVEKTPNSKTKRNKRDRSASKKNDKPSKRRKRIREIAKSDSDSEDDMFADNSEEKVEDTINNSDDEQPVVKHKIETPPPIKNKRRKLVDKTYEDEEGFIITSKEWVYESASEDEKEQKDPAVNSVSQQTKADTETVSKTKKDILLPVAGNNKAKKGKKNTAAANQPTLMSFFKKS